MAMVLSVSLPTYLINKGANFLATCCKISYASIDPLCWHCIFFVCLFVLQCPALKRHLEMLHAVATIILTPALDGFTVWLKYALINLLDI